MLFQDNFSNQAGAYAASRPRYPAELYVFLSSLTHVHQLAWDCATGNGQAAVALAPYFDKVIATDGSEQQIAHAEPNPKIEYRVALAENSGLSDHSTDMITVATALHWFNLDEFYKEVKRVGKPGSVLAIWAYFDMAAGEKVHEVLQRLTRDHLRPYMSPSLSVVAKGYKDIAFPFQEIDAPPFAASADWTFDNLTAFVNSWSFSQKYKETTGKDPLDLVIDDLRDAWGNRETQKVFWPLVTKFGRI